MLQLLVVAALLILIVGRTLLDVIVLLVGLATLDLIVLVLLALLVI